MHTPIDTLISMWRRSLGLLFLSALLVYAPRESAAQALNWSLHHQGFLLDEATETPLEGIHQLRFNLYLGNELLWTEDREAVFSAGLYAVTLGELTPLEPTLFDGDGVYSLEIAVDGNALSLRKGGKAA